MQNDTTAKPDPKAQRPADQGGQSGQDGKPDQGRNHGEGNPQAAARFNKAEQDFVNSPRGQEKIREAGNVRPDEQAQLDEAERTTRSLPTDGSAKDR
jgi:hypothetical protein